MAPKRLRTVDLARAIGVHVNTIRYFETLGYFPEVGRGANGYRLYTRLHLEQARLIGLALLWPQLNDRELLIELVRSAAEGDFGMAMELAYRHLAHVRVERTHAEAAVEFLERWAGGHLIDTARPRVTIREAARRLNVSVDQLRNWERNGLIDVPRDPESGYRLYGTREFARIRVIRTLVQAGYSLMAILRMLRRFDAGERENLRDALNLPREESANEYIEIAADRRLASLVEMEERAQAIIRQIGTMIEMVQNTTLQ
jgi:DNA-binding transcriptional MerR regulator